MTVTYRPPEGERGSILQARREVMALAAALDDPQTFAIYLQEEPDATLGLMEPHGVEVGIVAERVDGGLVLTAYERDTVLEA